MATRLFIAVDRRETASRLLILHSQVMYIAEERSVVGPPGSGSAAEFRQILHAASHHEHAEILTTTSTPAYSRRSTAAILLRRAINNAAGERSEPAGSVQRRQQQFLVRRRTFGAPSVQRDTRRHITLECLVWLNATIPADSALSQPLPWPLTLNSERLLQMAPPHLGAPRGFHVRAAQPAPRTQCKRQC